MADRPRVLVTCPQMQRTWDHFKHQLDEAGYDYDLPEVVQALSEAELLEIIDRYDGFIAGDDDVTGKVIEQGGRLKVISKWGVGVDGIDRETAKARGVVVTNTPGTFGEEVADVALGYIVMLARQLHVIDRSVRDNGWAKPVGLSIAGKTLGVIGLGSIGQAVVRRGVGFGMTVLGYDPYGPSQEAARKDGADVVELDELLSRSRFVSLNCPLTPETRHIINAESLAKMSPDAYLVNTGRGPLVDEAAVAKALGENKLAGAGLDVFEVEPLPADSPLRGFDNVILGSHNGSNTGEATMRVSAMAVDNLIRELKAALS